jgi:hypothetical protein
LKAAGARQVTPTELERQATFLYLQHRRLVDGCVDTVHPGFKAELGNRGADACIDHIQQPFKLLLVWVDVTAETLKAFGAIEGLPLCSEVILVIGAGHVDLGHGRRLVLSVSAKKLIEICGFVSSGLNRHRVIVAAFRNDAELVMVSNAVERVPDQQVVNRALDEAVKIEIVDGRLNALRQLGRPTFHSELFVLPCIEELCFESCGT